MITVIKKDIGREYYKIDNMFRQVWGHPNFSLTRASQAEVARMRADRQISDDVVNIMKFLNEAKFATADQIARGTNLKIDDTLMMDLYQNLFVNMFVLSELDSPDAINEQDALKIYTLDFGGDYLLSIENVDMTNWRYTQYFASTQLIVKALQQVELLINLRRLPGYSIREYNQFTDLRAADKLVKTDFDFSLLKNKSESVTNYIGFFLEPGFEDLYFRDSADSLDMIFNQTNSWLRYYPLGQDYKPRLLIVIRDSTDVGQIKRTIEVLAQSTDFVGGDVCIVGYNEIVANGIENASLYSFQKDANDAVQVGKLPNLFS